MIKSRLRGALSGLIIAGTLAAATMLTATPAAAHPQSSLPSICGHSTYFIVSDRGGINGKAKRPVKTSDGWVLGYVYLLYSNYTDKNCVVTRKNSAFHGISSLMRATLRVEGLGEKTDLDFYEHYADVQRYAPGRCVKYSGMIASPNGTYIARGGRDRWGNCS